MHDVKKNLSITLLRFTCLPLPQSHTQTYAPIDDMMPMQRFQAQDDFSGVEPHAVLFESPFIVQMKLEIASRHQIQDKIEMFLILQGISQTDHKSRVDNGHQLPLHHDIFNGILSLDLLLAHAFDCIKLTAIGFATGVDGPKGTATQHPHWLQVGAGHRQGFVIFGAHIPTVKLRAKKPRENVKAQVVQDLLDDCVKQVAGNGERCPHPSQAGRAKRSIAGGPPHEGGS
jgi:hypothetical protein